MISPRGILNPGSLEHEYYTVNFGVVMSAQMECSTITLKPLLSDNVPSEPYVNRPKSVNFLIR
jgi:hypothetical protein